MPKRKLEDLEGLADAANILKDAGEEMRQMQGQGDKKHSIDSDEEDEVRESFDKFEKLDDDDIEGQEESKIAFDGDIPITPFNLKEEQQEGSFSKDGNFIWNKKDEITDSWLDNIDWVKIKEVSKKEQDKQEKEDEEEDEKEEAYNELTTYRKMLEIMKPNESVAKALRRFGGNKKAVSSSQRWKKKKQGEEEDPVEKENREKMLKLTGYADEILSRSGNMEIYEETYEAISFKVKQAEDKVIGAKTSIPEGVEDDDALDMFADSLDEAKVQNGKENKSENKTDNKPPKMLVDEVMWEFKWEDDPGAEVHGPHDSETMFKWQDSGFFDKGVFCRKVDSGADFNSSKRIDFELYT